MANPSLRIAANVRAEQGRQRITTTALATRAGIRTRTMYRLVSGEREWTAEELEAVADALATPLEDLLGLSA